MNKVVIANDHSGVELASRIKNFLEDKGFTVNHLGTYKPEESVDYPDMADKAVKEFKKGGYCFGVLICGTGIGISVRANKHENIVCALPQNVFASQMAREHNDANFIAFGARIEYKDDPLVMLDKFISSSVDMNERHTKRRVKLNSPVV